MGGWLLSRRDRMIVFLATSGNGVETPVHVLNQIRARLIPGKSKSKPCPERERCSASGKIPFLSPSRFVSESILSSMALAAGRQRIRLGTVSRLANRYLIEPSRSRKPSAGTPSKGGLLKRNTELAPETNSMT